MVFRFNLLTLEPRYNTNSKPRLPFLKPKPSTGSAFCPVISKSVSYDSEKRPSLCSQEVYRTMTEIKHSLNDSIADQLLLESTKKERPQSPVPDDKGQDFTSADVPHEVRSLLPQTNNMKAISPNQLVIFPPEIPSLYCTYSKSSTPEPKKIIMAVEPTPVFTSTFNTNYQTKNVISRCSDEHTEVTELKYLPKFHGIKGQISEAMEIAPDRPFTPVAVTEPIIKPSPWISLPIENENRPESPLVAALKTAPEKSYSPLPTFTYASELLPTPLEDSAKEVKIPVVPQNFNFKSSETKTSTRHIGNNPVRYMHGYNNRSFATASVINSQKEQAIRLESNSILLNNNQMPISGLYKSFSTDMSDFNKSDKYYPQYLNSTTFDQNVPLNHSRYNNHNISAKSKELTISDDKSTSIRTLGPGIKNKIFTFTPNTPQSNEICFKQLSIDRLKNPSLNDNSTSIVNDSVSVFKSNHTNTVKLTKAVPFFSNST